MMTPDKKIAADLATRVRLKDWEIEVIRDCFIKNFMAGDKLWLFGSRVYLEKRGGDIDLYVQTALPEVRQAVQARSNFWADLQERLGEQKIDIVLHRTSSPVIIDIYNVAQQEGVRIV